MAASLSSPAMSLNLQVNVNSEVNLVKQAPAPAVQDPAPRDHGFTSLTTIWPGRSLLVDITVNHDKASRGGPDRRNASYAWPAAGRSGWRRRGADGSGRAGRLRTSILLAGELVAERRVRCGPCPGQLLGLAV